jgi:hypothetical protein
MKINKYQIHYKMYGYRIWFSDLKCTKTSYFHMKENVEI